MEIFNYEFKEYKRLKDESFERCYYFVALCDDGWFVFTCEELNYLDKVFDTCIGIDKSSYESLLNIYRLKYNL